MALQPEAMGAIVGAICVGVVALFGSTLGSAEAKRPTDEMAGIPQPTQRDYTFFEARLSKASSNSDLAKTCGRGEIIANASIHVAMHFSMAQKRKPGFAIAHVESAKNPKALILDSDKPTLWKVTGEPSVIILTGDAVIADSPDGVPVFAPRFAERCAKNKWPYSPRGWRPPAAKTQFDSLVEGPENIYANRAHSLSNGAFHRDVDSWQIRRGSRLFKF